MLVRKKTGSMFQTSSPTCINNRREQLSSVQASTTPANQLTIIKIHHGATGMCPGIQHSTMAPPGCVQASSTTALQ